MAPRTSTLLLPPPMPQHGRVLATACQAQAPLENRLSSALTCSETQREATARTAATAQSSRVVVVFFNQPQKHRMACQQLQPPLAARPTVSAYPRCQCGLCNPLWRAWRPYAKSQSRTRQIPARDGAQWSCRAVVNDDEPHTGLLAGEKSTWLPRTIIVRRPSARRRLTLAGLLPAHLRSGTSNSRTRWSQKLARGLSDV